jgi:hypothetical protein
MKFQSVYQTKTPKRFTERKWYKAFKKVENVEDITIEADLTRKRLKVKGVGIPKLDV